MDVRPAGVTIYADQGKILAWQSPKPMKVLEIGVKLRVHLAGLCVSKFALCSYLLGL